MFRFAVRVALLGANLIPVVYLGLSLGASASAEATNAVGRTPGTFAVSRTGAATYTIPIWAPPGPNGMQPHIVLAYNSQQGNGFVGVGWNLSGLSSIYRCNLTYAQDAAPAPVALVTGDGYCMDGQRLRLTGGTYGTAGSTYQTEVANFVNVTAYGSAGNGPGYFIAQDRNGRTYTYGNGGNSQVLLGGTAVSWQLNQVKDPPGNTMTIAYNTATGFAVPSTISWTPSSYGASTYNYTMTFSYGANVVPINGYTAGNQVTNANLLGSITVANTGTTVKKYVLTYQVSPTTGRDELINVQECADSGATNCLAPTRITYQNGAAGVTGSATTAIPTGTQVLLNVNYDFNGDGYKDLVYCNGGSPNIIYVAFGSASGYGTPVNTGIGCSVLYGDLKGTGQDGILAVNGSTWYYYTWNGSSFVGVSTGLAYDSTAAQYLLADVNGDGLPDLISSYMQTGRFATTLNVYTRLNTTQPGGAPTFASATTLAYTTRGSIASAQLQSFQQYGPGRNFDFNGDGRQDLSLELVTGSSGSYSVDTYELISTGSTFTATQIASFASSVYAPVLFLNFNSDACTDYLVFGTIYIAGCNGSVPATVSLGSANVIGAMDWNGDGLTDILVQNGSTIGVYESTGVGLSSLITTSAPYSSNNQYLSLDANGDGLDDLGVWVGANTTGSTSVTYYPHNGAGQPPDLVASVTDGFGNSASPTYVSLVQSNYTKYSDATYPYQNYIGTMYVVNKAVFSDPSSASGGTYNQTFSYYGAWTNLQGRGLSGFEEIQRYDSRNALWEGLFYDVKFPYVGILDADDLTQDQARTKHVRFSWIDRQSTLLNSAQYNQRYFVYIDNSTIQTYEVGGSKNAQLITTSSTNYTFDNFGNPTSIATTLTDNDSGSGYYNDTWTTTTTNTPDVDTTHWCLGLFTQIQVAYTSTLSGSASVTRLRNFTPDTTNCRYTQIVTEPNSSQYKVTETLGYDSFGNVNSDSVTGVGMGTASPATRTTTINWTTSSVTTGQFPMTVTDPSSAQTQFSYNFNYGLKSSITDANNLTTSWQYGDGFGRKTQENRADGTYTTWAYNNCTNAGGCLLGNNTLALVQTVYNSDGTVQTDSTTYFDELQRQLVNKNRMLANGTYSRNEVRYDNLGRVTQQAMPCTWSSVTTTCTYWTTNQYDVLNRLYQTQRPISSTNGTLQTTGFSYAGRTTTVTDPQSNASTTVRDVNGWLRQAKDAYGYTVSTSYDAAGSKTGVTDSSGNTLLSGVTYNYGIAPFLAAASDMDLGAWTFTFDALGEMTGWRDAKSQSFSATYDALSRRLTRTETDLFTQWTWGSSPSSHNVGKLQSVCTGTGSSCSSSGYSESETYDSVGRQYQRAISIPGLNTFTYTRQYNSITGLLNTLTYPVSTSGYALQLQYGYQNGILQSVTDVSDSPNVTVWQANSVNPAGQVTQETLGNGIVTNRTYDAVTHWLGAAQSGVGGGAGVKNLGFLYDEMGNVAQRQDNNLGLTENIYYDNDYRFSYSKLNGTQNLSVTYDATGNITSRSDVAGGATWTYDPVHKHEVTQAGSSAYQYAYDANGNANTRQGSSINWSSYNYPTSISAGSGSTAETISFAYGPDRQRFQQNYSGNSSYESTYYIGTLLEFVVGSVNDYRHYIYGGAGVVAVYSRKTSGVNTFSYLLSDHQSSGASITNSSGAQVVGESFSAFGNRRNPTTWSGAASNSDLTTIAGITREGYTFQTALGLWMGMNHMNGRVQDALTGRFLSADPYIPDPTNTQSYNRYSYVNNNPLSRIDPSGFADTNGNVKPINAFAYQGNPNYGADVTSSSWGAGATQQDIQQLDAITAAVAQGRTLTQGMYVTQSGQLMQGAQGTLQQVTVTTPSKDPVTGELLPSNIRVDQNGNYTVNVSAPTLFSPQGNQQAPLPQGSNGPFFRYVIQPAFRWTTCPAEGCTAGQTLGSLATVPGVAALAAVATPGLATAAAGLQDTAPAAVLATAAAVTPDGVAVVAESMDAVGGAELAQQVGLATQRLEAFMSYLQKLAFGP